MKRLALFGVAAATLFSFLTAGHAATTLKFVLKQTSLRETGDGFIFKEDVFQRGAKVGSDRGVCKYVVPAGSSEPTGAKCKITITLAGGKIVLSGKLSFSSDRGPLTVTGGTGEYAGASGTGSYRNKADETTALTLHLD
jgi:hypothetical protein